LEKQKGQPTGWPFLALGKLKSQAALTFAFAFLLRATFFFAGAFGALAAFSARLARLVAAPGSSRSAGVERRSRRVLKPSSLVRFSSSRMEAMSLAREPNLSFTVLSTSWR